MNAGLARLLRELDLFLQPIRSAVSDADQLAMFMNRFGYGFSSAQFGSQTASASTLLNTLTTSLATGSTPDLTVVLPQAKAAFSGIRNLPSDISQLVTPSISGSFFDECFDLLLHDYLLVRSPITLQILIGVEALTLDLVEPSSPQGRSVEYLHIAFDWGRLSNVLTDFDGWAVDVYGWGTDFQDHKAIQRLSAVFDAISGPTFVDYMTPAQLSAFLPNAPVAPKPLVTYLTLFEKLEFGATGELLGAVRAGVAILPTGASPATKGLAVAPYATGAVNGQVSLGAGLKLVVSMDGQATGGGALALQPDPIGMTLQQIGATSGNFEFGFVAKPATGSLRLVGGDTGSRVEADAFHATLGGSLGSAPDIFVAAGLQNLKVIIDPAEDGFLGKIIQNPLEIEAGDILMGWRPDRGVYFESGTSLEVTVPVERNLGPVDLHSITVGLDWKTDLKISAAVTADAQLGPLYAYVKGLGVEVVVKEDSGGALGKYDLDFKLKKPTGYAVALDASPIVGGGYLDVLDHEYRGALALKLKTIGFSAFAILDTELPGGAKGFSFIASIFGEFTIPIGQGFFLTGLGGFIGINRTVDSEALRDVLFQGELGDLLFPPDPIAAAPQILANMAAIFPAKDGQYLFGPAARIEFSKPPLVTGKIAVILEMGGETRLLILGALYAQLPNPNSPIVDLRLAFMGVVDFAAQTIAIDATLQGSKILTFPVSGDVAIRTGWSGHADQLMFFGGCHPEYASPVGVPSLRRLSISFGSNNPRITLTSYQALTLNSLQFGAHADLYAQGPRIEVLKIGWDLAAEGHAYFDALIYFNPFSFDIALGADLSLLVNGKVKASLGFDLRLSGPNEFVIHGHVWVTVCKVDIDFALDHAWGSKQSETPAIASPASLVWAAFSQHAVLEPVAPVGLSEGVVFAKPDAASAQEKPLNPMGGARLSQRAAPLGIEVEKIGEARVVSGDTKVDLKLSDSAGPVATDPLTLEFVRGHFWPLSGGDRLRAPAFENHKAGLEIAADASLTIAADKACGGDLSYETIELGVDSSTPAVFSDAPFVHYQAVKAELIAGYTASIATPLGGIAVAAADAVSVQDVGFVLGSLDAGGGVRADLSGVLEPTFSHALAAASAAQTGLRPVNPAIAAYFTEAG